MATCSKWEKGIDAFNENNWLGVNILKVGHKSSKRFVDIQCLVPVTNK